MAKKGITAKPAPKKIAPAAPLAPAHSPGRPSALLDTRVVYCGDNDAFEAVMEREGEGGRQRGFFVAFGYTKDAEQECNAFYKRTGRIIKLVTVQKILDEEFVQRM